MGKKREGQCAAEAISDDMTHFCVLDAYHPGLAHKTAPGWFFGSVMARSDEEDLKILERLRYDIVSRGIDVGELAGLEKGELKKMLDGIPTQTHQVPLPPWVIFNHKDGTADILPAGRPGDILEKLPLELAKVLVQAANKWSR